MESQIHPILKVTGEINRLETGDVRTYGGRGRHSRKFELSEDQEPHQQQPPLSHCVLIIGNYCHDVLIKDDVVIAESLYGCASFISIVLDGLSIPSAYASKIGAHRIAAPELGPQVGTLLQPYSPVGSPWQFDFGLAVGVGGEILSETLDRMLNLCTVMFVDIQSLIWVFDFVDGTVKMIRLKEIGFFHLLPRIRFLNASAEEAPFVDVVEARKLCCVLVTNGQDDCTVHWKDEEYQIAPFLAVQIDPTGAGDSFLGGLVAGLVQGLAVPDAAVLGNFCDL
ncbi:pfkB-like carbohydrate kinase family protein [Actinidia rufa]|uniref:PfkB-like carbohydrate kinase family protein n=1 Tax=Actinidia rufa TaxID=165716 RepID=A0A7J0FSB6_9ERIC|nr:pfkB-like carbohydrate kinase family protein [Actinidia rufa]